MKRPASKVALPKGGDREAFLDAAYELIRAAWVRLDEAAGKPVAYLTPRAGSRDLKKAFLAAYAAASARRKGAKKERALEAASLSRALTLAATVDARRREPGPALPPERLAEIAALLAEHEADKKDHASIKTPWEDLKRGPR